MKKILVTGSKFTGTVVVVYGEAGMGAEMWPPLLSVDMSGAVLNDSQKEYMLQSVPIRYGAGYEQGWGALTGKVMIITEDFEPDFDKDFWIPYGNKLNRKRSVAWWTRASKVKRVKAVVKLQAYLRHLGRNQWKNKANPETYLNDEYFETDWDNT